MTRKSSVKALGRFVHALHSRVRGIEGRLAPFHELQVQIAPVAKYRVPVVLSWYLFLVVLKGNQREATILGVPERTNKHTRMRPCHKQP